MNRDFSRGYLAGILYANNNNGTIEEYKDLQQKILNTKLVSQKYGICNTQYIAGLLVAYSLIHNKPKYKICPMNCGIAVTSDKHVYYAMDGLFCETSPSDYMYCNEYSFNAGLTYYGIGFITDSAYPNYKHFLDTFKIARCKISENTGKVICNQRGFSLTYDKDNDKVYFINLITLEINCISNASRIESPVDAESLGIKACQVWYHKGLLYYISYETGDLTVYKQGAVLKSESTYKSYKDGKFVRVDTIARPVSALINEKYVTRMKYVFYINSQILTYFFIDEVTDKVYFNHYLYLQNCNEYYKGSDITYDSTPSLRCIRTSAIDPFNKDNMAIAIKDNNNIKFVDYKYEFTDTGESSSTDRVDYMYDPRLAIQSGSDVGSLTKLQMAYLLHSEDYPEPTQSEVYDKADETGYWNYESTASAISEVVALRGLLSMASVSPNYVGIKTNPQYNGHSFTNAYITSQYKI